MTHLTELPVLVAGRSLNPGPGPVQIVVEPVKAQVRRLRADTYFVADETSDAVTHRRLSAEARERYVVHLLETLPHAAVSAITADGFFVPMPAAVPLCGQTVIQGHATALEFVVPEDFALVIKAWQDATAHGLAQVEVRPLDSDTERLTIIYLDARDQFGVFLLFVTGDLDLIAQRGGDVGAMRPRVATVRKNQQAHFIAVDDAAQLILGHDDLVGRRNLELVHPEDQPRAIANWIDMLANPGSTRKVRLRQQHRDGHWVWFEITNTNCLDDPAEGCVVAEMIDISEEMAAHEHVRLQENLLRRLTDSLPVGVVQVDGDGRISHRNPRVSEIVGQHHAGTVEALFSAVDVQDRMPWAAALAAAASGSDCDVEIGLSGPHGSVRCHVILRPSADRNLIICINDVTVDAVLREQLQHRATYDQLTGCHNRASVWHALELALSSIDRDQPAGGGVGVVFIDLDGFKAINDRQGHAAGDALLTRVGTCLQAAAPPASTVGRFGGDEFVVILTGVASADQAVAVADRLAQALTANVRSNPTGAAASIGVAWTQSGHQPDLANTLVMHADAAMYESKREGAGRPVLHQDVAVTAA